MIDKIKGITITLESDIRVDDIEYLLNTFKMLRGVATAEPIIVTSQDYFARERLKIEMRKKLLKIIDDIL